MPSYPNLDKCPITPVGWPGLARSPSRVRADIPAAAASIRADRVWSAACRGGGCLFRAFAVTATVFRGPDDFCGVIDVNGVADPAG